MVEERSTCDNKIQCPGGTTGKESGYQCRRFKMQVQSLGREDLLEKGMATHSSVLVWRISWTEEPGRLQSIVSQRVISQNLITWTHLDTRGDGKGRTRQLLHRNSVKKEYKSLRNTYLPPQQNSLWQKKKNCVNKSINYFSFWSNGVMCEWHVIKQIFHVCVWEANHYNSYHNRHLIYQQNKMDVSTISICQLNNTKVLNINKHHCGYIAT